MKKVIIAGCGYLGRRLAHGHLAAGDGVLALVRSAESRERLRAEGIEAQALDLDRDDVDESAWPDVTGSLLYWLVPPPPRGEVDSRSERFLRGLGVRRPARVVVLSTTGVYGDCAGDWVDESRPPRPQVPRALRRLSAERLWSEWAAAGGVEWVILRLAGFYGPGRLPLARLRQELPMLREAEAPWSNRIHVDDLVAACLAAMDRGRSGEVYNVSDGHPSTMLDYFNRVADLAGLPRPPQVDRAEAERRLSGEMLGYLAESRRIDNGKLRRELGLELRYPTLAEGLPACLPLEDA